VADHHRGEEALEQVERSASEEAQAGEQLALPIGSGGISVTPNVGHRGVRPSARSKVPMGKFVSTPPSTSVDEAPSAPASRTGSKKNGIDIEARTASATRWRSGSQR
jgi:hypothetical protein